MKENGSIRTLTIEGRRFQDREGFYEEIDRVLTKDLGWDTGHNLDALNDLLRGGFNVHEYEEPIRLVWKYSTESRTHLGTELFEKIVDLIRSHEHIELILA